MEHKKIETYDIEKIMEEIDQRISESGCTIKEICKKAGMTYATYYLYRRKKLNPFRLLNNLICATNTTIK